jgi:CubicO group peptidase (beta-lactamase class C family)
VLAAGCMSPQNKPTAAAGAPEMPVKQAGQPELSLITPQFDAYAEQAFTRSGVPGMAVAVVKDDKIIYLRCFGVKNITTQKPVTPHTRFQLASISKSFTSASVASMVGKGELAWDDPAAPLLPDLRLSDPYVTGHVTFRDLLSHRTGLPAYAGDELQDIGYGRQEIISRLRYVPLTGAFRSSYAYANIGITIAAEAAAQKAGMPWEDLVAERVLIPAGMSNTSARFSDFENATDRVDTYPKMNGTAVAGPLLNDDPNSPAGGVSSTISDMARYARLQVNGGSIDGKEIINRTALEETHRPQNIMKYTNTTFMAYGLGWENTIENGRNRIEHGGDLTSGVSTYITLYPEEKMAIVVLTNSFPGGHILKKAVNRGWEDLYFTGAVQKDWYGEIETGVNAALQAQSSVISPGEALPPAPAGAHPDQPLAAYTGWYWQDYYGHLRIEANGTGLCVYPGLLTEPYCLVPYEKDTFREVQTGTRVDFFFDGTGTRDPRCGGANRASCGVDASLGSKGAATAVRFTMFEKPWNNGTFFGIPPPYV